MYEIKIFDETFYLRDGDLLHYRSSTLFTGVARIDTFYNYSYVNELQFKAFVKHLERTPSLRSHVVMRDFLAMYKLAMVSNWGSSSLSTILLDTDCHYYYSAKELPRPPYAKIIDDARLDIVREWCNKPNVKTRYININNSTKFTVTVTNNPEPDIVEGGKSKKSYPVELCDEDFETLDLIIDNRNVFVEEGEKLSMIAINTYIREDLMKFMGVRHPSWVES